MSLAEQETYPHC